MAVNMVVRRKGDYKDPQLALLRGQGVPLLKKYGAVAHSFGYYHSGAHAGHIFIVITYPDLATHERAWQGMAGDADETHRIDPTRQLTTPACRERSSATS
jgi:hypothetical protein